MSSTTSHVSDIGRWPDAQAASVLAALRRAAPRVQCLTNTVAQAITGNCLLALGVRVSMATHRDEIIDMTRGADALLINLGTMDSAREQATALLLDHPGIRNKPIVLDPVFVEHSPLRMGLARRVLSGGAVIVKGNANEIAALRQDRTVQRREHIVWVTTGATDVIEHGSERVVLTSGHPLMAQVTGLGCALGAVIAAFAAVADDPVVAAIAALTCFGLAGERAGAKTDGSGTFAAFFIDELCRLNSTTLTECPP